ncbi:hypothetical protein BOX15_Mlig029063g1, partial [Macrostomum lignano]
NDDPEVTLQTLKNIASMSSDGAVSYVDSRCYSHRGSITSCYSGDDPMLGASLFNLNEAQNSLIAKESVELHQLQEESPESAAEAEKLVALGKMERGLRIISAMAYMPSTGMPFSCRYRLPESGLFLTGERLTFSVREGQSGVGSAGGKQRMRQLRRGIQRLLNLDLSFEITFSHGIFTWTVTRKWSHWRRLYPLLLASGLLPHMGTKPRREHGTSMIESSSQQQHRRDSTVSAVLDNEEFKRSRFEEQLKKILDKLDSLERTLNLLKFLGVSRLSFVRGVGGKCGEAEVSVHIQRYAASPLTGCQSCIGLFARKKTMWMVIKERCIVFLKDNLSEVKEVFLLDSTCLIINGLDPSMRNYLSGFVLRNSSMLMIIQCDYGDYPMLAAEMTRIKELLSTQHQRLLDPTPRQQSQQRRHRQQQQQLQDQQLELIVTHRSRRSQGGGQHNFGSFAGTRANCPAKWYVDGATYFADIFDAMEQANEEIFICDWWLTPEVHLKRPDDDGHYRLMNVLQRRADAGVQIFILIYKEVKYTLKIDSWYTKLMLRTLNKCNIHVLRHPNHLSSWEFLWAHHEKLVVVDQKLAFVGGIDLCWGRWDTQQHRITDLGDSDWTKYPPLIPVLTSLHSPNSSRRADLRRAAWLHKLQELQHFSRLYESNAFTPQGTIQVKPAGASATTNSQNAAADRRADSDSESSAGDDASAGPAGMDRISELSSADEVGGQDTRRTVVLVTERAEDVAQKQQQQPLPDRAWSRASVVSDRLRKILRRGGDAGDVAGGGGSGSDSVVLRRYASTAEAADAVVAAAGVGADVEVETAKERRADDDRRLVADTPDAKRLKDGQVQVRHYDPVMQRMGNFLRSNAEKRRVTRGVRERLRRGEHSNGIYEIDPNFAIRPDEAAKIRMWRGKDYVNWILKEPVRLHLPEEELVDRGRVPRMPWHDIGCVVGGNAARDVARHFIERWNFTVKSKSGCQLPLLMPKSLKPEPAGPDNSDLEPD